MESPRGAASATDAKAPGDVAGNKLRLSRDGGKSAVSGTPYAREGWREESVPVRLAIDAS